jgi:hypothetical protein
MWNQLGVLGSRVVEAVFVSEDQATVGAVSEDQATGSTEDISEGRGVGGTVGAVMEGSDVKTLIAKRMGIPKGEVNTRLISLHQKGELNGTADRSAGPSDRSLARQWR